MIANSYRGFFDAGKTGFAPSMALMERILTEKFGAKYVELVSHFDRLNRGIQTRNGELMDEILLKVNPNLSRGESGSNIDFVQDGIRVAGVPTSSAIQSKFGQKWCNSSSLRQLSNQLLELRQNGYQGLLTLGILFPDSDGILDRGHFNEVRGPAYWNLVTNGNPGVMSEVCDLFVQAVRKA